jgi:hypothetical protein
MEAPCASRPASVPTYVRAVDSDTRAVDAKETQAAALKTKAL